MKTTSTPIADSMFPQSDQLYVEIVKERGPGNTVVSSTIREAIPEDIERAKQEHALGKCSHSVIRDERGWMYDYRWCAICGAGLGAV